MGMFIVLEIDRERCLDGEYCGKCVNVCPVDVFGVEAGRLITVPENEDECTLCDLCLQACPEGAIQVVKLYEEVPSE